MPGAPVSVQHAQPPKSVAELITIISAAAAAAPEIAGFVRALTEGERSAVEQLRATLPADAPTAKWEREHRYAEPPAPRAFRGVLADSGAEKVEFPPEYENPDGPPDGG